MSFKRLLKSFKYAFAGLGYVINQEQNMRIHISVASLITAFAYYYGISRAQWAALFAIIAFVLFAEAVNTAIERLADAVSTEYSEAVKHAKDVAAGAVTIVCGGALLVGVAIFLDIEKIGKTLTYIFTTPSALAICTAIGILDILFLIFGGKRKDSNNE